MSENKWLRLLMSTTMVLFLLVGLAACQSDAPGEADVEEMETMDDAVTDPAPIDDAYGDDMGDEMDEMGDDMEEGMDEMGDEMEEMGDDIEDAADDAAGEIDGALDGDDAVDG